MRWRNPLMRLRNTEEAARASFVGGAMLVATGGTGAVAAVQLGRRLAEHLGGRVASALEPFFLVAGLVAALGGISVIAAGFLLTRQRAVGKVLLVLGSGVGLLSFAAHVVVLTLAGHDAPTELLQSAATVQGMALLIVLYAQLRA